jgi:hypothetical protein
MSSDLVLELFGYLASAIVAVSLTMTSLLRLRVINLVGAALFTTYGVLIEAWPVVALNAFIVVVNIRFLTKILRRRDSFSLLEVDAESPYLLRFLEFHMPDIQYFLPGFRYEPSEHQMRLFVLRDVVPAGLLIGTQRGETLDVQLDYATPGYRDLKIGRYLFGRGAPYFSDRGIERFISSGPPRHVRYLERVGYSRDGERWVRVLDQV